MCRNRKAGGRGCSVGVGLGGHENVLELDRYRRTVVKPPNATELFTLKWSILCYVNFLSVIKRKGKTRRIRLNGSISDFPLEPEEFHWGGLRWPHRVGEGLRGLASLLPLSYFRFWESVDMFM